MTRKKMTMVQHTRLMAAAPDLYEALERQRANIEHWLETGEPASTDESRSIYEQIVAALTKATGERT